MKPSPRPEKYWGIRMAIKLRMRRYHTHELNDDSFPFCVALILISHLSYSFLSNQAHDSNQRGGYETVMKKSDRYEAFYKIQNLIPEEEFEEFMETLRNPLPVTFRLVPIPAVESLTSPVDIG